MKGLPEINLSLHRKLIIVTWLMVIYLVLLLCGIASFIAVTYMKSGLEEQSKAAISNSQSVLNLKALVLKTIIITDTYIISGGAEAQNDFNTLNMEISTAYAGIYAVTDSKEKQRMLDSAIEEWQQVRGICTAMLGLQKSQRDVITPEIAQQSIALNGLAMRLQNTLDNIYEMFLNDSINVNDGIKALDERTIPVILLLFITSLGINSIAIVLIIRSVVIPTHLLARAAHNYARGSLSYRIPLDSNNEIGELARTFNYMAEKLESSYTALKDMAIHDGLTGILNHHEFQKRLLWEFKRALRYKRPLSLVMMDIDRFKTFNDTYGHQAGDSVLRAVGQYLSNAIRSSDEAARYGGEEFALIMPETPADTAFITAQRIGVEIANLPIVIDENVIISITMSIGVATFPQDAATREELIAAADRMLYRAKQSGRNRVCKSSD
jgi:two-component system cell cycle response regulator